MKNVFFLTLSILMTLLRAEAGTLNCGTKSSPYSVTYRTHENVTSSYPVLSIGTIYRNSSINSESYASSIGDVRCTRGERFPGDPLVRYGKIIYSCSSVPEYPFGRHAVTGKSTALLQNASGSQYFSVILDEGNVVATLPCRN